MVSTLGFLALSDLWCLYHDQSQHKEHFLSQLTIKIPELCSWLILGCIPFPWPNGWNILNGKAWIMCPILEVGTGIESGKNSFSQSKINMVKRRNRNQKNGCRADKINMLIPWCWGRMSSSPGLSFVQQHITVANELIKEDWRMAPIRLFCPMPGRIECIQFNSTQFNSTYLNSI